jgi:hypothetical protein
MFDYYLKLMNLEFEKRTELLLKRLDVTLKSFMWSDHIKKIEPEIMEMYKSSRDWKYSPKVYVEDIMAASLGEYIIRVKFSYSNTVEIQMCFKRHMRK